MHMELAPSTPISLLSPLYLHAKNGRHDARDKLRGVLVFIMPGFDLPVAAGTFIQKIQRTVPTQG